MNEAKEKIIKKRELYRKQRLEEKEKNRKLERINIRCTTNEKKFIDQAAEKYDITVTELILESALFFEVNFIDLSNLKELTIAINRLDNNINQIARNMNILMKSKEYSDMTSLQAIATSLDQYGEMIDSIKNLDMQIYRAINNKLSQKKIECYNDNLTYDDGLE